MPVNPELGSLRQEDYCEFGASLSYIVSHNELQASMGYRVKLGIHYKQLDSSSYQLII